MRNTLQFTFISLVFIFSIVGCSTNNQENQLIGTYELVILNGENVPYFVFDYYEEDCPDLRAIIEAKGGSLKLNSDGTYRMQHNYEAYCYNRQNDTNGEPVDLNSQSYRPEDIETGTYTSTDEEVRLVEGRNGDVSIGTRDPGRIMVEDHNAGDGDNTRVSVFEK